LNEYLLEKKQVEFINPSDMTRVTLDSLFRNLHQIKFLPTVLEGAATKLTTKLNLNQRLLKQIENRIFDLFSKEYHKSKVGQNFETVFKEYLDSSELKIHQVIDNWPQDIGFWEERIYKDEDFQRIISTVSDWKVAETVRTDFTNFLRKKDGSRMELRRVVVGKIRDLFKTEFEESFLNHGLMTMLQKYLEKHKVHINDIIQNWPLEIPFKKKLEFGPKAFRTLISSINDWKISPEALSGLKAFIKAGTKKAVGESKRKLTDNSLNWSKKARKGT
jgi:hypothetical protein